MPPPSWVLGRLCAALAMEPIPKPGTDDAPAREAGAAPAPYGPAGQP
ncbi:hypothetical protein [Streptomyces niveus]